MKHDPGRAARPSSKLRTARMFPIPKAMSSALCCATKKGAAFGRRRGGRFCAARVHPVIRRSCAASHARPYRTRASRPTASTA